ncbi:MAG: sulfonate ABC transporter [Deltaproteobacteria bacterium]|nr:sulfonate ABC transporter [Deltaproteobacteria bacterium]
MADKAGAATLECPLCDCEVPINGDEKPGEQVFCPYCEAPLKIKKDKADKFYLQEDF